jgi:pimeloyl-ACP methyl ester carboxylesterase
MKPLFSFLLLTTSTVAGAQASTSFTPSNDSVSIAYEVHGQGKTALVFVHGWSCDRTYWKPQLQYFSKNYQTVAIDLGGHGESGFGRKDWTIYSFGSDVASVVKKLDLKRVILVGHSMGGDVIADAALQLPGRVLGLVMVDTYKKLGAGRTPESVQAFIDKLRPHFSDTVDMFVRSMFLPSSDSSLVNFVAKDMASAPPSIALSALTSSFHHSREITKDFEKLKLPVVALNPDNEPTDVESMKKHGVDVVIMPGVGHFLMMEDPERFNKMLQKVITKLDK